jgi:hypothetical protein
MKFALRLTSMKTTYLLLTLALASCGFGVALNTSSESLSAASASMHNQQHTQANRAEIPKDKIKVLEKIIQEKARNVDSVAHLSGVALSSARLVVSNPATEKVDDIGVRYKLASKSSLIYDRNFYYSFLESKNENAKVILEFEFVEQFCLNITTVEEIMMARFQLGSTTAPTMTGSDSQPMRDGLSKFYWLNIDGLQLVLKWEDIEIKNCFRFFSISHTSK